MSAKKGQPNSYKPMFTWQYDDGKWMDGWMDGLYSFTIWKTYTCYAWLIALVKKCGGWKSFLSNFPIMNFQMLEFACTSLQASILLSMSPVVAWIHASICHAGNHNMFSTLDDKPFFVQNIDLVGVAVLWTMNIYPMLLLLLLLFCLFS